MFNLRAGAQTEEQRSCSIPSECVRNAFGLKHQMKEDEEPDEK